MKIYDSHIHSENSFDAKNSVESLAETAIELGLSGITITDHFSSDIYKTKEDFQHICKSCEDAKKANNRYAIEVYKGVELGDWMYNKELGNLCIKTCDFDFILASLHSTAVGSRIIEGFNNYTSFEKTTYDEDILFLETYYTNLKYTAENADFDVIAHLTYPLRYMNGAYNKNMSLDAYEKDIIDILEILISRGKGIEINTSGFKNSFQDTMPYESLVKKYYDMGGKIVTVGSDSHTTENIAIGFDRTFEMLKRVGFKDYYYYKSRKPVPVSIL